MLKPIRVGRYLLFGEIAAGGMATVHYGRVRGAASFARIVAIKRLHPHLAKNDEFSTMFLDEARIAARIQHPNAANILDVVSLDEGELLIVMEYISGESLSRLLRRLRTDGDRVPPDVTCAIVCDALQGLHAAHEAKSDQGEPLGIVHRDVSPQNLLVGGDGITRLVDFGVAKARGRIHETREGQIKGKLAYMPPEQLRGQAIDRRCDIYAMGVVMWEALTGHSLFHAESEGETVTNILERPIMAPSEVVPSVPKALDAVVLRALAREPNKRFATARDMAAAIEVAGAVASARKVATFVTTIAGDVIAKRQHTVEELERHSGDEEPDSAIRTAGGIAVETDASKPTNRRLVVLAVVAALVTSSIFAAVRLRGAKPVEQKATVSAVSVATSIAPAPSETASVSAALTTSSAVATSAAAVVARRPIPKPHETAAASVDKPCPLKTFIDADGIVQFRRECPP